MRPGRLFPTTLVLALLALPASAGAAGFDEIFSDYRGDGDLDGCYSPGDLYNAGQKIPPDIEQYAPGFGSALSINPGCSPGAPQPAPAEDEPEPVSAAGAPGPGPPPDVTKKAVAEPPAPKAVDPPVASLPRPALDTATAVVRSETPGALIALLLAAGVAVVLALGWAVAWLMGWSPERLTKPLVATFQTVWDRLIPGR